MAKKQQGKIKASTQEHLDIDDITENLVILKNGWVALVMGTTAVNFDILSEAEQDATIYAYGALLNSLTFPMQILIRSKKADITAYYQHLVEAENSQANPDLKAQIRKYREFVQATVQQKTILDKRFYLIVHFSPLELGVRSFKKTDTTNKRSKIQLITDAKNTLYPKRDHIVKQTARLGLFTKQLTTQEIIELFYDIYNPAPTGTQRVILNSDAYTIPLVEPDVETPTPAPGVVGTSAAAVGVGGVVQKTETGTVTSPQGGQQVTAPASIGGLSPIQPQQPVIMPSAASMSMPVQVNSEHASVVNTSAGQQEALKGLQDAIKRAGSMGGGK